MKSKKILTNGRIYTMVHTDNHDLEVVEAIAITDGRILATGDNATIRSLASSECEEIDLNGQVVLPGFIDAHLHFLSYGLSLQEIDLMGTSSRQDALSRIQERADATPEGQWLTGRGWDQVLWTENAFPTRHDLDPITANHPAFLRRKCGHAGWANSQALALAGIDARSPDPAGGEIERDPHSGEPTGILKERAMDLVANLIQEPTHEQAVAAVQTAMEKVHQMGIVGVHNMEGAPALRAFQDLHQQGKLKLRVLQQIPEVDLDAAIQLGVRTGLGDEWLQMGALKIFADGSLGARSAQMIEPYEGEPDNYGIAVSDADHLNQVIEKAARAGIAVYTHAIGDQANRNVLDAIEATRQSKIGLSLRHRIEHAQILHPDDLGRFAALNVIPSMQPIHCTQDIVLADAHWGSRCRGAYAWSSLLSSGAHLAFSSDAPVETPDIFQGIYAAVTRRHANGYPGPEGWYPEECVTVAEAVYAYTVGAAYASGEEHIKGSLEAGKLADLVMLSDDIFEVGPEEILKIQVDGTMIGGEWVYQDGSSIKQLIIR